MQNKQSKHGVHKRTTSKRTAARHVGHKRSASYSASNRRPESLQERPFSDSLNGSRKSRTEQSRSRQPYSEQSESPRKFNITRRDAIIGGVGIAAVAAIGGVTYKLTKKSSTASSSPSSTVGDTSVLNVPEKSVFTTEQCEYIEDPKEVAVMTATAALPYGTLVWASDDDVAACLLPTETSSPLAQIGLFSLGSATLETSLKKAVGQDEGFEIYDGRANSNGIVWVEANVVDNIWRVYTTTLDGLSINEPVLAAQGGDGWDMPTLAVYGSYAYWQELPTEGGSATKENSLLKRVKFGFPEESVEEVISSKGRMACPPSTALGGIICAPRAEMSGTYYQLTLIDGEDAHVVDKLVLPSAMRPCNINYGNTGFGFSFDNIYNYGGGISNLGTYAPANPVTLLTSKATSDAEDSILSSKKEDDAELTEEDIKKAASVGEQAVADLYSSSTWFRFPRNPFTPASWCGNWMFVKSTNVVTGIDMENRRYFSIEAEHATQNYGEYLATSGDTTRLVTYANIDYTPLNSDPIKECRVRVWEII